jgi:hypothetical protein
MRKVWAMAFMTLEGVAEFLEKASPKLAEARA